MVKVFLFLGKVALYTSADVSIVYDNLIALARGAFDTSTLQRSYEEGDAVKGLTTTSVAVGTHLQDQS